MVSSFEIRTNIAVPAAVRKRFNEYSETIEPSRVKDDAHPVHNYFDQGFGRTGVDCLDWFLEEEKAKGSPKVPLKEAAYTNNWRVGRDGILMDDCEKFHGAVSMLEYFIHTFFEPEGVKLSGTIVGVNTERALAYVYNVVDNAITLDEDRTRKCLEVYEFWTEKVGDEAELDVIHAMMGRDVFGDEPSYRHYVNW